MGLEGVPRLSGELLLFCPTSSLSSSNASPAFCAHDAFLWLSCGFRASHRSLRTCQKAPYLLETRYFFVDCIYNLVSVHAADYRTL
jgi:hypothetical protein